MPDSVSFRHISLPLPQAGWLSTIVLFLCSRVVEPLALHFILDTVPLHLPVASASPDSCHCTDAGALQFHTRSIHTSHSEYHAQ
jgi:hypothetical protein